MSNQRFEKERIYTEKNYKYIEDSLKNIEMLIDNRDKKEVIQSKYKQMKEWLKIEYNKILKYKNNDGYISQWYDPLISDIYVQSFSIANVNSPVDKIKLAIYDALDYFSYWNNMLIGYKNERI
ncbi:hypothetical protein [Pseudobacteroides cellulosolvens]|uniref:Uncharacterized protein n=1 Tax=Pseudobacteroides cellulosolvens ATCC 35603 = DSM 2933 TaxID=398512 RepID=A0A0L6JWB8_9FIRM|nr:hypothetical protein [Pseudobacteroides cellulosolvens]KNY30161.1 hypothetical protein Bccel_5438 [Pseudobacteroides cellulosolvens ATCC 35603 = DSM 2933]